MKTSGIVFSLLAASATVMARSTVYMVTSNDASAVDTYNNIEKPTIGLDAFSMVLSHMTDTADCHPIQHMQQAYKQETIAGAKAVWNNRAAWWSHAQDDVFERKLDNGLFLVVSGMDASEDTFSMEPSFYVSDNVAEDYMVLADDTAQALQKSGQRISVQSNMGLFDADVTDDTGVFDLSQEADRVFLKEVDAVKKAAKDTANFVAIKMEGLQLLEKAYGTQSSQYQEARRVVDDLIQETVIPDFQELHANERNLITVIFTPTRYTHHFGKRGVPETLQESDTCYVTEDACLNGTSSCSGRGECVPDGKSDNECYVCKCQSSSYLGDACQVEDAIGDFQLLFWTGVTLLVLTAGAMLFVYKDCNVDNGGIMMVPQVPPKQD
ncbi:hypothetical protein LRAMOSA04692 [Lichtheimia ramosa]|uniref:Vacuolar sorting protein Vps3844 C-terminal domain-containing protein n=1 Tax=Lichtheimia ramosa TaxID=688394 RepID=A0A077WZY3_9FUNG|nr:hypothetical protein LRAMOSA04692 [Lichtheimia ramosa]